MRYFPGGGVGHTANRKFFKDVAEDAEELDGEPTGNQSPDEDDELYFPLDSELPLSDKEEMLGSSSDEENEDESDEEDQVEDGSDGTDIDDWQWDDGYGSA